MTDRSSAYMGSLIMGALVEKWLSQEAKREVIEEISRTVLKAINDSNCDFSSYYLDEDGELEPYLIDMGLVRRGKNWGDDDEPDFEIEWMFFDFEPDTPGSHKGGKA